ncbi:MAG: c-type cytochrome [Deltaproteobacteria bacterium]|nr:c-type cytochrome [Deltaproteobacteria bacterium]
MAEYEDRIIHDVDGIEEYDNPMPGWLSAILWGSILFSVLYLMYYALAFGDGWKDSRARAEALGRRALVQAHFDANPLVPPSREGLLAGAADPAVLDAGRERFLKTCASCHGEQAQGLIGPNLCDGHWLHGGDVLSIFGTVAKGVPAKGMPPWGRALPPEDLAALVSFIRSLQGSNPPDAKAPEGQPVAAEPVPGA